MTRIQFPQIRIYAVIFIIIGNWNEIVLGHTYRDRISNDGKLFVPPNRFRHHHYNSQNHHNQHQQHPVHEHQKTNEISRNRSDGKIWSSSSSPPTLPTAFIPRNRPDKTIHTSSTISPWLKQSQSHRFSIHSRRSQPVGQPKGANFSLGTTKDLLYYNKKTTKVNNTIVGIGTVQMPTLKPFTKKRNFYSTTTNSPFTAWVTTTTTKTTTTRPNYFDIPSTFTPKSVPSKSPKTDYDDSYYYDNENTVADDDDDSTIDDDDDDDTIDDDTDDDVVDTDDDADGVADDNDGNYSRTKNRDGNGKFLEKYDGLMDDYQFDEPLNRISPEKSGSLSEHKWREYGTAEAVENSRRKSLSETQLVTAHITRVHMEAMCRHPSPKVIQINEASKRYVPHCTILHRCGDDTGCCHSDSHKCVAKRTTTVDLYFYAIPLGMKDPVVETLSFVNHTECHCVERYSKLSRMTRSHILSSSLIDYHHQHHQSRSKINDNQEQLGDAAINLNSTSVRKVNRNYCHCTRHFDIFVEDAVEEEDDKSNNNNDDDELLVGRHHQQSPPKVIGKKCRCDCLPSNEVCHRQKKGQEGFSYDERLCIREELCTLPSCNFGDYSNNTGRCPRGKQKRTIRNHSEI